MDCSLPGSSIHGIFQARVLEWGAIAFSKEETALPQNCICSDKRVHLELNAREGNGTPLQYSCLENPMDGGAWKAAVHGVAEGRTQLSD